MEGDAILAKIALEVERAVAERRRSGSPGCATARTIAAGHGWSVRDVVCSSGPEDRPFEEQHPGVSISIVVAGTFLYRSRAGHALLTPGSLLLGNAGSPFECAHDHAAGDRCISFQYTPEYFERVAGGKPSFRDVRVPPLRAWSSVVARACAGLIGSPPASWEELAIQLAGTTVRSMSARTCREVAPNAIARVTRLIRAMERHSDAALDLDLLARTTGVSRYHLIRTFERVTGVTPHQFLLRTRLREAALGLVEPSKIVDVVLDSGFGDVSNFNRMFRAEFGSNPREWRRMNLSSGM